MEELQIAKLPSNFKVYEIDDYHAINCDKEACLLYTSDAADEL